MNFITNYLFLSIIIGIPLYAAIKKVEIYDSFINGAKHGVHLVLKIIPFLVGMIVAIGMLRASGFFEIVAHLLSPLCDYLGIPSDIIPLSLMRPFSGAASQGLLIDVFEKNGGNSSVSYLASMILGSTETSFYVVAIYFGAVNIKNIRYSLWTSLSADIVGTLAAIVVWRCLF